MELSICDRFNSLSPFAVRRTKASEVFLLIRRMNNYNHYKTKKNSKKNVIRRAASDNWF